MARKGRSEYMGALLQVASTGIDNIVVIQARMYIHFASPTAREKIAPSLIDMMAIAAWRWYW